MQQQEQSLFNNYKYCEICRNPLPLNYERDLCPACEREQLFREVKEYIRANDVTEYDVALEFNIPLHQVKQWIREGRIEYKENHLNTSLNTQKKCIQCGAPVPFENTLCSKCKRKQKNTPATPFEKDDSDNSRTRIRFH